MSDAKNAATTAVPTTAASLPPADEFTCGIAVYRLAPSTGKLDGRFALAVHGSQVPAEP